MLKVPGALTCKRERNLWKWIILNRKFVAVLRNVPIFQRRFFPSTRLVLGSRVPSSYLSGTIAHELRVFCYEGALHQSNGEYSFHCALKDHNLEMLRVINNVLSCMLNETCILLTSESTKINCVWWKKTTSVLISYLRDTNKTSVFLFLPNTCKYSACVCFLFELFQKDYLEMKATDMMDMTWLVVTGYAAFFFLMESLRQIGVKVSAMGFNLSAEWNIGIKWNK